jgi:hypothetical protein
MYLSNDKVGLRTFALAGFLIASMIVFSLVALPELMPAVFPPLRSGTVEIQVISTSGFTAPFLIFDLGVTVDSISLHRIGIGEGAWVPILDKPKFLKPIAIGNTPEILEEAGVPTGDYNLVSVSLGPTWAMTPDGNVTLKHPSQGLKIATAFTITEGKHVILRMDLSFDQETIIPSPHTFVPYFTVTVEEPRRTPSGTIASLKLLGSLGPYTLGRGGSKSSTFTIEPGSDVGNYLVHAEGGSGVKNTFNLEIVETGESWHDLTGSLWFLGGNLTAGTYTMNVSVSDLATSRVGLTANLYRVPRIPEDTPDAAFSGFILATSPQSVQLNEFALYLDQAGLYDFYLGVKSGDYEFLVDNNPTAAVSNNRTVTVQLEAGLHTFQVLGDLSGSGRDTSWSVGVVPLPSERGQPLSREAMLATGLLVIAIIIFVGDISVRRLRREGPEPREGETTVSPHTTMTS